MMVGGTTILYVLQKMANLRVLVEDPKPSARKPRTTRGERSPLFCECDVVQSRAASLPPTPSFIIPKPKDGVENSPDDKSGHKRTISVAIEASLLKPPPVPEPPTPTAQLYDLPELDMKQFTRSAKMVLPGINEDSKNGLGQEAGRRSSVVLAFKREENFVKKLLNLFPKPPETKPDANGWSDASYMLEGERNKKAKTSYFALY